MVHRSIDCSTWDDPWFAELQPKAKLLFLFLITNRRVTQCGAMEITTRQIAFETGLTIAEIPNLIESFGDRVQWWPGEQILIVRNFYRHQRANTGDKFDIAATKSAEVLPDFAKHWVYGVYPHLAPPGYTHPIPTPTPTPVGSHASDTGSEAEAEDISGAEVHPTGDTSGDEKPATPWDLFEAMCDESGVDVSQITGKVRDRQLHAAKTLVSSSATVDDIRRQIRWLSGQSWLTAGVDMQLLAGQWSKWVLAGKPDKPIPKHPPRSPYPFTREEELAAIAANPLLRVVGND